MPGEPSSARPTAVPAQADYSPTPVLDATERPAPPVSGYRVCPSLFGPRLWAMRGARPDTLLKDFAWSPRRRLRNNPGEELARIILIHWLDREPPIALATWFRARFLERLTGPEFTIPADAIRAFLAAQGVSL